MHSDESYPPDLTFIRTKLPEWNQKLKCWTIDSKGRMKLASKRNFQIMSHSDPKKDVIF